MAGQLVSAPEQSETYSGDYLRAEHVTADQVGHFYSGPETHGTVTNSIFTSITNTLAGSPACRKHSTRARCASGHRAGSPCATCRRASSSASGLIGFSNSPEAPAIIALN